MQVEFNTFSETEVGSNVFVHTWKISNFKALHPGVGCSVESVGTLNEKTVWEIGVYPDGCDYSRKDHVAVNILFHKHAVQMKRCPYLYIVSTLDKNLKEEVLLTRLINKNAADEDDSEPDGTISGDVDDNNCDDVVEGTADKDESINICVRKLVKRCHLYQQEKLLPNGSLTFRIKLYFPGEIIGTSKSIQNCSCVTNTKLYGYEYMFNQEKFSDVKIIVDDKELWAYKGILAHQSPVFEAMFESDVKENSQKVIEIEEIDYDVIQEMLRFMYTGKVNKIESIAHTLLIAANKYAINDLQLLCEKTLSNDLKLETVISLLVLAENYQAKLLKSNALEFFKLHGKEIIQSEKCKADINKLQPLLSEVMTSILL